MPGRGDDINHAVADVQMRDSLWPMVKLKESTHGGQVRSDDLNIWRRSELYVASVMIAVSVGMQDRKSTRLNSSHVEISYDVFCLKKKQRLLRQPRLPEEPRRLPSHARDARKESLQNLWHSRRR